MPRLFGKQTWSPIFTCFADGPHNTTSPIRHARVSALIGTTMPLRKIDDPSSVSSVYFTSKISSSNDLRLYPKNTELKEFFGNSERSIKLFCVGNKSISALT